MADRAFSESPVVAVNPARLVVAASGTGAGKTLVATALCAVLRDRGLRVRAYKSGPDYIDARLYASVLGMPAYNLDLWLDGEDGVLRNVAATAGDADVLVIEGMMGLFDGDDRGLTSTAKLARTLDAPVLTVLDTWTSSQSAAAVALGLRAYDPELRHMGAILNRVGGPTHVAAVQAACARVGIEILAAIPRREEYVLPERTLGLDRRSFETRAAIVARLAEELASQLDIPALLAAAASSTLPAGPQIPSATSRVRVAYAEDEAFWFTYPETLDALRCAGAELVSFSPLRDEDLPRDLGALWIGGGYPEDHGAALEANERLRNAIRQAVEDAIPTYAECGGLMYLAEQLHTAERTFSMAGAIAGATSIAEPRLHIGYRDATAVTASPFDDANAQIRGYEFHYATPMLAAQAPAYVHAGGEDGAVRKSCVAAFLHRHFLPGDRAIGRFIATALVAIFALTLGACGGGGGGGTTTPPTFPPTATPSPTPTVGGGFVPASGPITTLSAVNGNVGTTMLASSSAADFIVQAGDNPGGLSNPAGLPTYTVSASESAGLATSSIVRRTAADIAANHLAMVADGIREIPPSQFGVERIIDSLRRSRSLDSGALRAPTLGMTRFPKANVGDQRTFKVLYQIIGGASTQCPNTNIGSYTCYVNVPATLEAIGQHSYVWVDNNSLANPNEFPSTSYFTQTASNFDSYYAIETVQYGPAFSPVNIGNTTYNQCDSNGNTLPQSQWEPEPDMTGQDPHISILVTEALAGTGEGGYFYSGNEFAQQVLNCSAAPRAVSNELPMVVIGSDNYGTSPPGQNLPQYNPTYWLNTDMPRSLSHELQHLSHSINKYYSRLAQGLSGVVDDAWIDEGCSMLAEDIAANGIQIDTPRYSYTYLLEPSDFSLTPFIGYQPNNVSGTGPFSLQFYTAGNYGAAYLFLRYIYDRFGGATALHAIYADTRPGPINASNISPVLAAAGNEPWAQLYGEWSIAISAQSTGVTNDPRYTLNPAVVLRGLVQVPSRRAAPQNIRNLVFGGPQPPESFDASGNLIGYVTLSSSSTPSVRALDGATNFFLPTPVAGGATVRAQAGSLPAAQGGMVQGNLPTPMPTSY